jgi:hypothetical protein
MSDPGPSMTLGNAAAALVWLLVLHLVLALSGCSTRAIDIICPRPVCVQTLDPGTAEAIDQCANGERLPPLMLGNRPATRVWLMVWCKQCQHHVEPDPAEMPAP